MKKRVTAAIVNYNGLPLLESCLKSLAAQTQPCEVIFLDNDSHDGSAEYVRGRFPEVTVVETGANLGYAAAANMGVRMAQGDFVMVMNPDVILEPDYIEKCVAKMDEDEKIGAITGKLLKYDFGKKQKTDLIDTVGLYCFRNRRIIDDGQGMKDDASFDTPKEVFGVSGACPLYRKKAMEDVRIALSPDAGEYFDEDFFMYKEDVDLSWRLRLYGWKCFYLPRAVANHGRGTGVLKRFTHMEVLKNRSKLSRFTKYYSYKNQRLMQVKNELGRNFLHDFFPIMLKEILIGGYIVFREPYLLKSFFHMLSQLPRALRKRRFIMRSRRVGWKEMQKWLGGQAGGQAGGKG